MSKYIWYYNELSMYTGIIMKVIIEHVKVNIKINIKHKYLVFTTEKIVKSL